MTDRLLAIDASSSAIGWAIFHDGKLQAAGVVKSSAATWAGRVKVLQDRLDDRLFMEFPVDRVVMEWSEGRGMAQLKRMGRSAQSGVPLAHGQGAIWQWLRDRVAEPILVKEGDWTGRVKKEKRAPKIQARYPDFAGVWADDAGLDATDAVGIGDWFLAQERQNTLLGQAKSLKIKV